MGVFMSIRLLWSIGSGRFSLEIGGGGGGRMKELTSVPWVGTICRFCKI